MPHQAQMSDRAKPCSVACSVLLLVSGALAGCDQPSTGSVHINGDVLYINGRIDDAAANQVVGADFSSLSRVVIDSKGGSASAAFRIADKLRTTTIPLEVRGKCMSACASIILPASRNREMKQGSSIALHGTQFGLHHLFLRSKQRHGHELSQSPEVKHLAEREYALLKQAGADPRLLMVPYIERGDVCYVEAVQPDGEERFTLATELATYPVTTGTLAKYGLQVRTIDTDGQRVDGDIHIIPSMKPDEVEQRFNALDVQPCRTE